MKVGVAQKKRWVSNEIKISSFFSQTLNQWNSYQAPFMYQHNTLAQVTDTI
jgi:hypothetical protein